MGIVIVPKVLYAFPMMLFVSGAVLGCGEAEKKDAHSLSATGTMELLTYNVYGLPPLVTGDDAPSRKEKIAPLLKAYEIAAIQEDFD